MAVSSDKAIAFPPQLDVDVYGASFPDLADLSHAQLVEHYHRYGIDEGRRGNRLAGRGDFVGLIPGDASVLEIGPFCAPIVRGINVRYFDVLNQAGLVSRAKQVGYPSLDAPYIDFVSPIGDLSVVDQCFDYVVSSHCVEHQPDLIDHFCQVARILTPGGRYFVLVPDKRYCFDQHLNATNAAEVIGAHIERRKVHTPRSVIEHRALTTHNDCGRHWAGQHGEPVDVAARVRGALAEYEAAKGGYIDVHAWQFTPDSMRVVASTLQATGHLDFAIERLYPTRRDSNEFWCIFQKST